MGGYDHQFMMQTIMLSLGTYKILFNILPVFIHIQIYLHRTFLCKVAYTRYGVPWFISRQILDTRIVEQQVRRK
jgi:hypothetical protein